MSPAGTPMQFWHYREHPERIEPTARYSEQIIDFLSNETGIKYPWITYSQVMIQDFMFGAMENTSATTFGDFFWVDKRSFQERNYITVNAHEATHQWFGDYITGRHDGEQWLQESFATFYPGLFLGIIYGNDERSWYFREQMKGAVAAGRPIRCLFEIAQRVLRGIIPRERAYCICCSTCSARKTIAKASICI